jgi:hypothetical protein
MADDRRDDPKGVPEWLGRVCGTVAGIGGGWSAGGAGVASLGAPDLMPEEWARFVTGDPQHGAEVLEHGAALMQPAAAALGGWAGYALGARNPNKGLLILAGMVGGHYVMNELREHLQQVEQHVTALDQHVATWSAQVDAYPQPVNSANDGASLTSQDTTPDWAS